MGSGVCGLGIKEKVRIEKKKENLHELNINRYNVL